MKRLYHVISGLAGGVLLLAGCEGDTIVLDADPVAPEATTLSVTSDNPLYSAQEGRGTLRFKTPGGEVVFSVETNAETWSYTNDNEAWLAVEQNEYDGTLTLRVQRNEEASEPAAEVVVTAGEGSGARTWTVEVVQNAAGTPEIVATPNRVLIPACGSLLSASTEIACNYEDWEFTQSCDWMLVERRQDKLVFTADENTSSESRQVEVKLTVAEWVMASDTAALQSRRSSSSRTAGPSSGRCRRLCRSTIGAARRRSPYLRTSSGTMRPMRSGSPSRARTTS